MKNQKIVKFLSQLRKLNVQVSSNGKKLRCQTPEGVLTAALSQQIAERKAEILEYLQQVRQEEHQNLPAISVIPRDENLPLSFAQERLWFINQLEGSTVAYNSPGVLRISGNLNLNALEQALSDIVRRHEVLRTSFQTVNGTPIQVIDPKATLNLKIVDLQEIEVKERETVLQQQIQQEITKPFKLERAPLIRCRLWQLDATEYVFSLTMHHIISDAWSIGIFIQELSTLYRAFTQGEPSPLAELPIQYVDFAMWQRQWLSGGVLESQLNYWRKQLDGAPDLLELPTDHPRSSVHTFRGAQHSVILSKSIVTSLNALAKSQGVTLFAILVTALKILLFKWTGQSDIVLGTVIAGRNRSELEPLIGCFINFLAVRNHLNGQQRAEEFLQQVGKKVFEAYSNQDCPFQKIIEALNPDRQLSHNPIYNVALLLQNFPFKGFFNENLEATPIDIDLESSLLDLRFVILESSEKMRIDCEYNTDLFESDTIKQLVEAYQETLERLVQQLDSKLSDFELSAELEVKAKAAKARDKKQKIAIAATFTAEPVEESLTFWMEELDLPSEIQFAPYNQVFQELLNPVSLIATNQDGINIVLVRFEDWLRNQKTSQLNGNGAGKEGILTVQEQPDKKIEQIEQNVRDIASALKTAARDSSTPYLVCICPPSTTAESEDIAHYLRMENFLASYLEELSSIYLIKSSELVSLYPVSDYYDPHGDELGHIPYKPTFFSALGSMLARKIHALKSIPYKVIVLDCDETLWKGVCGEDGAAGVEIDAPHQALQEFIVTQQRAGKLICLCSKNQDVDVWAVFEHHDSMPLRKEHLVSWRINWKSKSENLKALAQELQLGLDSFIFIDDNPIECAEVQANCPEVLTIQLPTDSRHIPDFIKHIWAFDQLKVTAEDAARTDYYRQNVEREKVRHESLTFEEFLDGLELRVKIDPPQLHQLPRVAQLTQRTNQFNLTTIRRSEGDVKEFCALEKQECLVVEVKDRFGDYGLVGLLMFELGADVLRVDSFLLSCRVLGRGVEHQMLAKLGDIASDRGLIHVDVPYIPTQKNKPALDFLESVSREGKESKGEGYLFKFKVDAIKELTFSPGQFGGIATKKLPTQKDVSTIVQYQLKSGRYERIATELRQAVQVIKVIEERKQKERPELKGVFVAPRNQGEEMIAGIWRDVLKLEQVGINDNFFELGGHSLLATQLIAKLREAFELELPLRTIFESPTVAKLDQTIKEKQLNQETLSESRPLNFDFPIAIASPSELHEPFPLTEIQQAYWLGRQDAFELGNISTHTYIEFDCKNLDLDHLSQAWQRIINHHEMLRMVVLSDGQQQILPHVPDYQIEVFDLDGHSKDSINAHLETTRQQMSHEVFDAESWPLFKICATKLDGDRYRLHFSFDALIADVWSLMILEQQWVEIYFNPQTELPKVDLSFRDYILADLRLKETSHYQNCQKYWLDRIATLPSAPELPLVQLPSALKKPRFKRFSAELAARDWQRLKSKAHEINLTASGILLAAFSDVLSYWSKAPHFTINLTLFNRLPLHPQVNQIVGDFTSLTLLEVDNSVAATFVERAQRLQGRLWEDLDHSYVSGVEVQRELRRQRGTYQAMGVVFTSTLGFSNISEQNWLANHLGEMVYCITQTPQVWLDHQLREEEGALLFNWDVIEELFPANLLDDMFNSYCNYLKQLATDETIWMEKYPSLLPPQQLDVIQQLNQVDRVQTVTSQQTLDNLFVQQVKQRGGSLAAIAPELCLTYEQLYQHAVKLGHQLRSLGATTGTHIAVVMSKGWEQIVAVLGVLMAGCTYVPIDPGLPQQRQWSLLTQAQIQLVVTQEALYQSLSWPEEIECVHVEYNPHIEVQKTLEILHQPEDLAYIIYTSGSTGIPKGVMTDHQGAVNTIIDINQRFGVTADDRVLAVSALNFDLSVYDIFGTLAAGGTIVIPNAAKAKDPAHWLWLINAHQVTVWNSVPALMQMLVEYTSSQATQPHHSLRLALLSGDWIPLNLPQQIKATWTDIELVSLGGATEASIWSIYYPIGEVDPNWRSIPYGKPLGNQTMHVLNQWMEPAPVWVPGQIYIGGLGLARGYWKDEEKTAKHFIRHPLTQEQLYNTGDLGRYLPDGNIEFLGREDFQVKINGYRIELGEIEATLMRNSLVKKAVVNAIGDSIDRKKIVAYIVPSEMQPKLPEAYHPSEKEGIIFDPVERIEFKLKQHGLRKLESTNKGIDLPLDIDEEALTQAYFHRQTYRQFKLQPLDLKEFSQFLSCLRQLSLADKPLPKYLYPSAGNLYPVQSYLMIKSERLTGVEAGIYYYCPRQHRLVFLSNLTNAEGDNIYGGNQSLVEQAAFSLFLIAKLDAITPMYGELAERFCLLEAGHIGQLLMTTAPDFGIGLCPIGNLDFQQLSHLFKLESHQMLLYSFVGGKIEPAQAQQWLTSSVSPPKSSSHSDTVSQLRKHLQLHLPDYMLPSKLMLLDSLPLSANGKIDRRALPVPDNLQDLEEETFIAPRDLVELKLTQIWSEVLNVFPVGVQSNFFDIGGDSIVAIRLMAQIEYRFQRNLSLATLFQGQTIEKLATVLREEQEYISWSSLVPIQTSGCKPPFFCIAGGGGNVLYFYHLSCYLGQDQPFYALQAVGLDGESEPFTRVEDLAAHYIELIKSIQPKGPYFLGGHSFGGLVAFEVAQQLQKQGDEIALLAVLDMHAPDTDKLGSGSHKPDIDWNSAKMLTSIASIFERMFGKNIDVSYEFLQQLTFDDQLNYVNEQFQKVNLFPPETGVKQIRGLIQVARANQNACYVPQEVYPTQVTLFRASEEVPIELAPSVDIYRLLYDNRKNDPMWGWSEFSAGEVELHSVPGDHLTIMTEPYIGALAENLKSSLEKAQTAKFMLD